MELKPNATRLLAVDDFELFRRFVCLKLRQTGEFEIIGEASDGLEAIRKAEELQPELIVLDIELPKLDGIQSARQIRRLSPRSKIVFLSSESDPQIVLHALDAGALGYVQKLSANDDLVPALRAVLEGRQFVSRNLEAPSFDVSSTSTIIIDLRDERTFPIRTLVASAALLSFALLLVWISVRPKPVSAPTFETAALQSSGANPSSSRKKSVSASRAASESSSRNAKDEIKAVKLTTAPTIGVFAGPTTSFAAATEAPASPPLSVDFKLPAFSISRIPVTPPTPPESTPTRSAILAPDFVLDRTFQAHSSWVTGVAFSTDGQRLASGSWDESIKLWDVSTGRELGTVGGRSKREVQTLVFSPDGRWLATENSENTVVLWDATTGLQVRSFPSGRPKGIPGRTWVYSIAFSPDSRWLASPVDDKTIRIWDVGTGKKVRDLTALHRSVMYARFSPDGRWLASGDGDKNVEVWDVSTGQVVEPLSGHKDVVNALAFSPDGRWLASASSDKTIKLWDLATGQIARILVGHHNLVTSICFGVDSRWLASGSWDKTIKIWNVETGNAVQTLKADNHPVYTIAFDSSGRRLASGSEDGIVNLWRLNETTVEGKLQ